MSYAIQIILPASPAKVQILNCNLLLPFILIDKWEDWREIHYLEKHNVHIEGDQNWSEFFIKKKNKTQEINLSRYAAFIGIMTGMYQIGIR